MLSMQDIVRASHASPNKANATSFLEALIKYGPKFGLDKPWRYAQLAAQVMHESGEFRYDKEIWGPTEAQKRYDTRTDLGNTAAKDGDGKKYMGRSGIQITGKDNYRQFTEWCIENISVDAPNFVEEPEKINTDPWEGLVAIWYWATRDLNKYADTGNIEMITKKINGGLNGYDERVEYFVRLSLVLLGYPVNALKQFQRDKKLKEIDNDPGPVTRSELHKALVALTPSTKTPESVKAAPVTQVEAVVPEQLDKELTKTTGFWERVTSFGGLTAIGGVLPFLQNEKAALTIGVLVVGLLVLTVAGLLLHKRIIDAVKSTKDAFNG